MLLETFLFSGSCCAIWNRRIMTPFWGDIALSHEILYHRWTPHLIFQPPPPVPQCQFTFSSFFPFGTLLEKIPSPRPFLYSLEAGENHVQVILWQFPGRTRGVEAYKMWGFVSEILYYHNCNSTLVICQTIWFFLLTLQEITISFLFNHQRHSWKDKMSWWGGLSIVNTSPVLWITCSNNSATSHFTLKICNSF